MFADRSGSTSPSAVPIDDRRRNFTGVVLCSLVGAILPSGTTAGTLIYSTDVVPVATLTDSGQTVPQQANGLAGVTELRHLSGLTWDQVAVLFGVSKRAAHFWASGKTMAATHQEHLDRTLGCIRAVDRGSAVANREGLFTADASNRMPFDLLVARQYADFVAAFGPSSPARRIRSRPIHVSADRLPSSPQVLVVGSDDGVFKDLGPRRKARVRRGAA